MFTKDKKEDKLDNNLNNNNYINNSLFEQTYDFYSRHQSIFNYTEIPPLPQSDNKSLKNNSNKNLGLDLNTIKQMKKLISGSTQYTSHSDTPTNGVNTYSTIA